MLYPPGEVNGILLTDTLNYRVCGSARVKESLSLATLRG